MLYHIFIFMGKNVTLSLALEYGHDAGSPLHGFASAADHFGRSGLKGVLILFYFCSFGRVARLIKHM